MLGIGLSLFFLLFLFFLWFATRLGKRKLLIGVFLGVGVCGLCVLALLIPSNGGLVIMPSTVKEFAMLGIGLSLLFLIFVWFATKLEKRNRLVGAFLGVGICGLCVWDLIPPKGGPEFKLHLQPQMDDDDKPIEITQNQVDQAITVIEDRLDDMGVKYPLVQRQGSNGILLRLRGINEKESEFILKRLQEMAKIELHEVSPRSEEPGPDGKTLAARVLEGSEKVPGCKAYLYKPAYRRSKPHDKEIETPILLKRMTAIGGKDIAFATPSQQQPDAVSITLTRDGTDKMIALTKNMTPQRDRVAIVLNGEVISAPVVNQVPLGKNFIIEGLRDPGEVGNLAKALINPLENGLVIEQDPPAPAPKNPN